VEAALKLAPGNTPGIDALARYVRDLANAMRLRDFTIEASIESLTPPERARIYIHPSRKLVRVTFDDRRFFVCSRDEQRYTVIHELAHVPAIGAGSLVGVLMGQLAPPLRQVAEATWEREVESAIDHYASVIAPHLPLPAWAE
jgi:hypothetical protein